MLLYTTKFAPKINYYFIIKNNEIENEKTNLKFVNLDIIKFKVLRKEQKAIIYQLKTVF